MATSHTSVNIELCYDYSVESNFVFVETYKLKMSPIWDIEFVLNLCDRNNLKNWRGPTQTKIYFQ